MVISFVFRMAADVRACAGGGGFAKTVRQRAAPDSGDHGEARRSAAIFRAYLPIIADEARSRIYSERSARIGSTRVARRAGR